LPKVVKRVASQGHAAPRIADHVEQQLQTAYSEVLHEPIPARFLSVLDMLEKGHGDGAPRKTTSSTQGKPVLQEARDSEL